MSGILLRHDGVVVAEAYASVSDDESVLPEGALIVTLQRWQALRESLTGRRFGLHLGNTVDVLGLDPAALLADLIVLEFPAFADGRAYSQAQLLRSRLHFAGAIRATGAAVVRDQILGMARCGIDCFELRADQCVHSCVAALHEFSRSYQPDVAALGLPKARNLRSH